MRHSVGTRERLAAAGSLLLGIVAVALAIQLAVERFPGGLLVVIFLVASAGFAGLGLISGGWIRLGAFCVSALLLGFTFGVLVETGWNLVQAGIVLVLMVGAFILARKAFSVRVPLPDAEPPESPVLFFNPKSGD